MKLHSERFTFNFFEENTYLLYSDEGHAVIIDPGCSQPSEERQLVDFVEKNGLTIKEIWLTHAHIDHVLGLAFCVQKWGVNFRLHSLEVPQLKAVEAYAPNYGVFNFSLPQAQGLEIIPGLLSLGNLAFQVLFVPGHSPGHVAFYHAESGRIWSGDVLFQSSVGRTDLPGGDFDTLAQSIRNQLYSLPEDTVVFPGHGSSTTIGLEKRSNYFVRA